MENNDKVKNTVSVKFTEIKLNEENREKISEGAKKAPVPKRIVKLAPPENVVTLPVMPPDYNKKVRGEIVKK